LFNFFPFTLGLEVLILKLNVPFPLSRLPTVCQLTKLKHLEIRAQDTAETSDEESGTDDEESPFLELKDPIQFSLLKQLQYLSIPRQLFPEEFFQLGQLNQLRHLHLIYHNMSHLKLPDSLMSLHLDFHRAIAIDALQCLRMTISIKELKLSQRTPASSF